VENPEESAASFSDFLLWMATMIAVQFGDLPHPETGQPLEPNLPAARHFIDIMGMLQEKTAGNLTPTEEKLIDDLLFELRKRFLDAQGGQSRIIVP
jgi:hypothetical protein